MPTAVSTRPATTWRPSAVTWIDGDHAFVATTAPSGDLLFSEVRPRQGTAADDPTYLARVVEEIGERERVEILGPDNQRLALEREYVLIYHRPDRLIDVEPSIVADRIELAERVRALAGG